MSVKRCHDCGRIITDRRYQYKCLCRSTEERVLMNGIETDLGRVYLTFDGDHTVVNIEAVGSEILVSQVERDWTHQRIRVVLKPLKKSDLTHEASQGILVEKGGQDGS